MDKEIMETEETEQNDEFDYDDDGNIIIPEVEDDSDPAVDEEFDEADDDSDDENAKDAENVEDGTDDSDHDEKDAADGTDTKADAKEDHAQPEEPRGDSAQVIALRRELEQLKAQAKDTLKILGYDEDDPFRGLAKVAAESNGKSLDDYIKDRAELQKKEDAFATVKRLEFEDLMRKDLIAVQTAYPETKQYKSIRDIPNFARFGQLRDAGLTPKEAYIAANPDSVRASVASAVNQQNLNASKSHLKSVVPKGRSSDGFTMTREEYEQARDLFPGKSKKEIYDLYKQIK